ncbi:MAG: PH domain-containing protein [Haloferacaceae archaeon]
MRLSPLSVPYRVVRRGASVLVTVAFVVASGSSVLGGAVGTLVGVALVGAAVVLLVGYEVAYWRRYEYELTEDTLDIGSGVFARRNREIPLRRIQNVDIRRNVVQRLLGIAAVDLETAGGGSTEAAIRYVSFAEARRLQRDIARLKRGAAASETGDRAGTAEDAPAEELFRLTPRELALAGALSFDVRGPGALLFVLSAGGVAVPSVVERVGSRGALGLAAVVVGLLLLVVLVSWVGGAAVTVLNYYDFRLARVGDELQYGRGLLRRYDGSIPLDKVQTLTVTDNPLKRRFGYATLYIETAGYAPGGGRGDDRGSQTAVPLAEVDRVFALADEVEPFGDPDLRRPPRRVRRRYAVRYLLALGGLAAAVYAVETVVDAGLAWYAPLVLVPLVLPAAHLKWCHRGHWLGPDHLVTRNGVLRRETRIVPYYRVQTVIDTRTVFQRRWRLGTVTADTAGSLSLTGGDAAAVDVAETRADELREALAARLESALAERGRRRGWGWNGSGSAGPEGAAATDDADPNRAADRPDESGTGGTTNDAG